MTAISGRIEMQKLVKLKVKLKQKKQDWTRLEEISTSSDEIESGGQLLVLLSSWLLVSLQYYLLY